MAVYTEILCETTYHLIRIETATTQDNKSGDDFRIEMCLLWPRQVMRGSGSTGPISLQGPFLDAPFEVRSLQGASKLVYVSVDTRLVEWSAYDT